MFHLSEDIIKEIEKISGAHLEATDLTKFSTMKLMSRGHLIRVETMESLQSLLKLFNREKVPYRSIGWGANFILPSEPDFVLIKLDFPFKREDISPGEKEFTLSASAPLNILTSVAQKNGFKGWEVFTGIPASLGGAIAMNAGTSLGEIGELVKEVTYINKEGELITHRVDENSFSYRKNHFLKEGDIIVSAVLFHHGIDHSIGERIKKYLKMRTDTQPLRAKTCGCMFKNKHQQIEDKMMTCRAGLYLDIMGLKGLSLGQMRISPKHANFMENLGNSSDRDVKNLVNFTLEELELHYGVTFETEVHIP